MSTTPSTTNLSDQRPDWLWGSQRRSTPLDSLAIHPFNESVYGTEEPPDDLIQSMKSVGQLHPVLITKQNLILSGARRYNAAKILGWEIIDTVCIIADNPTKLETQQIIIEANRQRVKSDPQIKAEVRELLRIEKELSGQRRAATLKQNKRAQHTPLAPKGRATEIVHKVLAIPRSDVDKVNELETHAAAGDETAKSALNNPSTGIAESHAQWKSTKRTEEKRTPEPPKPKADPTPPPTASEKKPSITDPVMVEILKGRVQEIREAAQKLGEAAQKPEEANTNYVPSTHGFNHGDVLFAVYDSYPVLMRVVSATRSNFVCKNLTSTRLTSRILIPRARLHNPDHCPYKDVRVASVNDIKVCKWHSFIRMYCKSGGIDDLLSQPDENPDPENSPDPAPAPATPPVEFIPAYLTKSEADALYDSVVNLPSTPERTQLAAHYGKSYTRIGGRREVENPVIPDFLIALADRVSVTVGMPVNYIQIHKTAPDGTVPRHRDPTGMIVPMLVLGQERTFHIGGSVPKQDILLTHGSLLVFNGGKVMHSMRPAQQDKNFNRNDREYRISIMFRYTTNMMARFGTEGAVAKGTVEEYEAARDEYRAAKFNRIAACTTRERNRQTR